MKSAQILITTVFLTLFWIFLGCGHNSESQDNIPHQEGRSTNNVDSSETATNRLNESQPSQHSINRPNDSQPSQIDSQRKSQTSIKSEIQTIPSNKVAKLGNIEIQIVSVQVGKVKLDNLVEKHLSKDDLLFVRLKITNVTNNKKLDFYSWQRNTVMSDGRPGLRDDIGNNYNGAFNIYGDDVPVDVDTGQTLKFHESIYPGKSISEMIMFEKPVDSIKYLDLELSGKCTELFSKEEKITFRIPASAIVNTMGKP